MLQRTPSTSSGIGAGLPEDMSEDELLKLAIEMSLEGESESAASPGSREVSEVVADTTVIDPAAPCRRSLFVSGSARFINGEYLATDNDRVYEKSAPDSISIRDNLYLRFVTTQMGDVWMISEWVSVATGDNSLSESCVFAKEHKISHRSLMHANEHTTLTTASPSVFSRRTHMCLYIRRLTGNRGMAE